MDVAFLGLGNLGRAIAKRLKNFFGDKINLFVWSRNPTKVELFASETSCIPIKDISSIPQNIEVVFLCLFDSEAVDSVLKKVNVGGKTIVDLTTNHPSKTPYFLEFVNKNGGDYLESPVIGSVIPALEGKLVVLTAGKESAYQKVEEFLKAISSKIFYFGDKIPLASEMKLVNNLVLGGFMAVIAEAVAIGEKLGFERPFIIEVLSYGAGRSLILDAKKAKLIEKDFSPHFSISLIRKDIMYLKDFFFKNGEGKFLTHLLYEMYDKAKNTGLGQLDFSSIYLLFKNTLDNLK